jgi:hypothetical protein
LEGLRNGRNEFLWTDDPTIQILDVARERRKQYKREEHSYDEENKEAIQWQVRKHGKPLHEGVSICLNALEYRADDE